MSLTMEQAAVLRRFQYGGPNKTNFLDDWPQYVKQTEALYESGLVYFDHSVTAVIEDGLLYYIPRLTKKGIKLWLQLQPEYEENWFKRNFARLKEFMNRDFDLGPPV